MVSEKQIEAAADQISEGLGAFLRKFCDSEASKRARYYLHEMPKDEWNQMALMLATEALTAAEQAEPAPAAEAVAWVAADTLNSPHPGCVSSLAYMSQIDKDTGREYVPLYTRPTPSEARLRERVAELEKALEPFAREADEWSPDFDDSESIAGETNIKVGHLRAARKFLKENGNGE